MSAEQTFLFADLAGFTALTEAHGDEYGADLAEAFCTALNERLPDGAEDFKMLGDACLVRVDDAAAAVTLALELAGEVGSRDPFPPVRIGMHTGPAIQRGGDWFGTTVNTASRVAALAAADEVLLTEATKAAAGKRSAAAFEELGERRLRNLSQPQRLCRVSPPPSATGAQDGG